MSIAHCQSAKDLEQNFFAKLSNIIQAQDLGGKQPVLAVAYSGGLDSSVLLHLACLYAKQFQVPLYAYHVNHGLSPNATRWEQHCAQTCARLEIPFRSKNVKVENQGQGIEAVARNLRYQALGELCHLDNVNLILLAHHLDDQAETMLMQLFRGTGLRGLAGMDEYNFAPKLLGLTKVAVARPLLHEAKRTLVDYAINSKLTNIEDESNLSTLFTRNVVRHQLMPIVEELFPNFSERLLRTSQHVREAQKLLDEVAGNDLENCGENNVLDLVKMAQLSVDRVNNLFRHWLVMNLVQLPSTAKIAEIQAQLWHARDDARVEIRHADYSICRYDRKIYLIDHRHINTQDGDLYYTWRGESEKYFPSLKGSLIFKESKTGVSSAFLKQAEMVIRHRQKGARLRLAKNRPSRDLKSHFQTAKIPFWQRENLPYIYINGQLFFVGLLGLDASFIETDESVEHDIRLQLIWQPDA